MNADKKTEEYLDESKHIGLVQSHTYIHEDPFELENGRLETFSLNANSSTKLMESLMRTDRMPCLSRMMPLSCLDWGSPCVRLFGIRKDPKTGHLERKPGWWNDVIGPGKAIDTNKFSCFFCAQIVWVHAKDRRAHSAQTIAFNEASLKPGQEKEWYGMDFPEFTIHDMVHAQKKLLDHLGVRKLFAVVGGSIPYCLPRGPNGKLFSGLSITQAS